LKKSPAQSQASVLIEVQDGDQVAVMITRRLSRYRCDDTAPDGRRIRPSGEWEQLRFDPVEKRVVHTRTDGAGANLRPSVGEILGPELETGRVAIDP
jgi:hypothetical protein